MRCGWEKCDRAASVILRIERPCGHLEGDAPTCPGHAEALVGETAKRATLCQVCGGVNLSFTRPETVRPLTPESTLLRRPS